jgi:hypothetical protein
LRPLCEYLKNYELGTKKEEKEIEAIEKEFPYSFYAPNKILGEVYGRRMIPREALWALETRARAYRKKDNSLAYCSEELSEKIREVDRVIEELKAAFQKPPPATIAPQPETLPSPPRTETPDPVPDTPPEKPPESKVTPPPVIQAVLGEGLLDSPPVLIDAECLQRLDDTGFIMINPRIKDRTVYLIKKAHTVLDVFDELVKMTGSEKRARAIMFQNMGGVKSTLDRHRPKKSLKT